MNPCILFSKTLGDLDIPAMCQTARRMGFDGIDLTVRPGGHVDTSDAGDIGPRIKRAAAIIREHGLTVPMLTTSVLRGDEPAAEAIFEAAGALGIALVKLGYWRYGGFGEFRVVFEQARRDLDSIEALAARTHTTAVIHNHSGADFLTAMPWTVALLLEGRGRSAMGAYVDAGHLVAEGLAGSWRQGFELLARRLRVAGAKSYRFEPHRPEGASQDRFKRTAVAYERGTVPWAEFTDLLDRAGFQGPVSFHCEYPGDSASQLTQLEADLAFFRGLRSHATAGR